MMLARIRRSVADASSLISPFGSTQRRIAACTSRKSPTEAARAANKGNFAASSRNCCRSHPAVSSNDAASRNSPGSSTAPGPSMRSNQPCGSASALLRESTQTPIPAPGVPTPAATHSLLAAQGHTWSSTATIPAACQIPIRLAPFVTSLGLLQLSAQMTRHVARRRGHIHQPPVCFAPWRGMSQLHFPHAIQHRLPEISEHREGFLGHDPLVQHFPDDRKLHERPCPAFACNKSVRAPDQLKEPLLPGLHPHFQINPGIQFRSREKICCHAIRFPASLFRAARHCFHDPAVTAATDGESVLRQSSPQSPRFFVVHVSFAWPRTSKHCHNEFLLHQRSSISLRLFVFRPALRRRHIEFFEHRHAQPGQCIRRFVTLPALIVAQERKNQPPPARRLCKSRKRPHMFDRARLRVNPPRRRCVFHAVFQCAVYPSHRQRRIVRPEPRLILRKAQQRHNGTWRH